MPQINETPAKPHTPIQEYVYHIPRPPSYWISPPNFEAAEEYSIQVDASYDYELTGFPNVDFLKSVNHTNSKEPGSIFEWNYEQRWAAQAILPFLYLGPTSVIRDGRFLQQHGITMVLSIRLVLTSGSKSWDVAVADPAIEISTIDVEGMQDLIAAFPRGIDIINAHMSKVFHNGQQPSVTSGPLTNPPYGAVLVCCETGNERSPCMIAAYLMAMYAISFVKAIQIVQAQRFSATLDEESKNILQTYHSILEAQRKVIRSDINDARRTFGNADACYDVAQTNKRSLDDMYDDEIDTGLPDMSSLELPVGKRDGQAPFQDEKNF